MLCVTKFKAMKLAIPCKSIVPCSLREKIVSCVWHGNSAPGSHTPCKGWCTNPGLLLLHCPPCLQSFMPAGAWKSVPAPTTVIHTSMDTLPHSPTTARASLYPDSKPFAPAEYHREPLWNQFFRLQPYKAKGGGFGPVCIMQRSPSAGQELLEILCCTSQCSALSTRTEVAWQCSQQENHILTWTLQSYHKKVLKKRLP